VDVLTPRYDMVARFQGGPNAGHTLEFAGEKYVLRSVPSGIFQGDKINIIGNGVVLDPVLFREEVESLFNSGHPLKDRLVMSRNAHLILPTHRFLDEASATVQNKGPQNYKQSDLTPVDQALMAGKLKLMQKNFL